MHTFIDSYAHTYNTHAHAHYKQKCMHLLNTHTLGTLTHTCMHTFIARLRVNMHMTTHVDTCTHHTHTNIHTHIYIYTYTQRYIYIYISIYICYIHIYIYIYICVCVCVCVCVSLSICVFVCLCACMRPCMENRSNRWNDTWSDKCINGWTYVWTTHRWIDEHIRELHVRHKDTHACAHTTTHAYKHACSERTTTYHITTNCAYMDAWNAPCICMY